MNSFPLDISKEEPFSKSAMHTYQCTHPPLSKRNRLNFINDDEFPFYSEFFRKWRHELQI